MPPGELPLRHERAVLMFAMFTLLLTPKDQWLPTAA